MNPMIRCNNQDTWERVLQFTDPKYFKANII